MSRFIWSTAALALGAFLWPSGSVSAADNNQYKAGLSNGATTGTTMTLGGQGTAAQAAGASDVELTRGGGGHGGGGGGRGYGGGHAYGGYRGGYGGYGGYRGYYGGYGRGFGYGYGGYGYGYGLGYPYYWPYYYPYSSPYYYGGYYGISGSAADAALPATYLGTTGSANGLGSAQMLNTAPSNQPVGGVRYDGGPANPVPTPNVGGSDTQVQPAAGTGLPVSLNRSSTTSKPYTFKAYGEK